MKRPDWCTHNDPCWSAGDPDRLCFWHAQNPPMVHGAMKRPSRLRRPATTAVWLAVAAMALGSAVMRDWHIALWAIGGFCAVLNAVDAWCDAR